MSQVLFSVVFALDVALAILFDTPLRKVVTKTVTLCLHIFKLVVSAITIVSWSCALLGLVLYVIIGPHVHTCFQHPITKLPGWLNQLESELRRIINNVHSELASSDPHRQRENGTVVDESTKAQSQPLGQTSSPSTNTNEDDTWAVINEELPTS